MNFNYRRNHPAIVPRGRRRRNRAIVDRFKYIKIAVSTISTLEKLDFCCRVRFIPRHERFMYVIRKHDPIQWIEVK